MQPIPGFHQHQTGAHQRQCHADSVGDHEKDPELGPAKGDPAEQHHQRGRTGNEAAGEPDGEHTSGTGPLTPSRWQVGV